MYTKILKSGLMAAAAIVVVIGLMAPASSVYAVEAESGSGSSGVSGGTTTTAVPRADDNPSASDLIEGTRVLVPETSDGRSGFDSARDMFERNLAFGMVHDDGVAHLQRELKEEGFFQADATGNFMELTKEAVVRFQRANGLPETGFVGPMTRNILNSRISGRSAGSVSASVNVQDLQKQIQSLMAQVSQLQEELKRRLASGSASGTQAAITPEVQKAAGVIITGGVSGPGYPTGPLNMVIPSSQLLFDRFGTVSGADIIDRQYEAPLETVPPTLGSFPITINGVANIATSLKVITNLKNKDGVGQHQGTVDIDIDTLPGGHLTLVYSGTATTVGQTLASTGTFKTSNATGIFTGLVAEGTYTMAITESGTAVGSPVTFSMTTVTP